MPWFPEALRPRRRAEVNPELRDVWGAVRQMQQHIGGLPAQLSTITLAQSRTDARVESLVNMLAEIRREQLRNRVDDEDQDQGDAHER